MGLIFYISIISTSQTYIKGIESTTKVKDKDIGCDLKNIGDIKQMKTQTENTVKSLFPF